MGARFFFTVSAIIDHADGHEPRRTADATVCQFTTPRGKRRAMRNAERRIMRRNPTWRRIAWDIGEPEPARSAKYCAPPNR